MTGKEYMELQRRESARGGNGDQRMGKLTAKREEDSTAKD